MSRLIQSERDGSIPVAKALTDLPSPRFRLAITSLASIRWTGQEARAKQPLTRGSWPG